MEYVIIDTNDGMMLESLSIKRVFGCITHERVWTIDPAKALHFNREEAEAVINFINDVIDWELAQRLEAQELKF